MICGRAARTIRRATVRPFVPSRKRTTPEYRLGGNRRTSPNPLSSVNRTRALRRAASTTTLSGLPASPCDWTESASCPRRRKSSTNSAGRFSSSFIRISNQRCELFLAGQVSRVSDRCSDVSPLQRWVGAEDILLRSSLGQRIENHRDWNPGSLSAQPPTTNAGTRHQILRPVGFHARHPYHTARHVRSAVATLSHPSAPPAR